MVGLHDFSVLVILHILLEKKDEAHSHLNDGVQMDKSHLSSGQLWNKASKPEKLKKHVDGKIASYIKYHGVGKMTVANSVQGQRKSESLELDEITGLEACEVIVGA